MWSDGLQLKSSDQQEAVQESKKMYNTLNMQICCKMWTFRLKCSNTEETGEDSFRDFTGKHQNVNV